MHDTLMGAWTFNYDRGW